MIHILKIAYYYKTKLQDEYKLIVYNDKYKFYFCSSYWNYEFDVSGNSNYYQIDFVSVDENDNVIGFLGANINRDINKIDSLRIINFKNKCNIIFSKDLYKFLNELFTVHNFNKIEFSVVVGNDIEKMYDKYCLKNSGRIVGQYKEHVKLTDGKLYDYKIYEIFREDYLKAMKI